MKDINIGLAGYGGIAKIHSIACLSAPVIFDNLPVKINLDTVCRRDENSDKGPFKRIVSSFDKLVDDKDINLISICTPNNIHFEQVKKALTAGKSVYCEKPLGLDYYEALKLANMGEESGAICQTALIYRFMPAVAAAREYILKGGIGEILNFRFAFYHKGYLDENRPISWRLRSETAGSGALIDLGIHTADLIRFILGDVYSVQAHLNTHFKERYSDNKRDKKVDADVDEYALLNINLVNGSMGTMECSRIASNLEEEMVVEIYGTKGSVKISSNTPYYPIIHDQVNDITYAGMQCRESSFFNHIMKIYPSRKVSMGFFVDMHLASYLNLFLNMEKGKVIFPETPDFKEAASSQKIIQAALISQSEGSKVVYMKDF